MPEETIKLTPDYITRRIEHAGATMRCLRVKHPTTLLAQGRVEIVREVMDYPEDKSARATYPTPGARDVGLMDEALSWILLIPNQVKRRLVGWRSLYHPVTEKHLVSFRECGKRLESNAVSAIRWHGEAIALLAVALAGAEVKPVSGCNVLPDHISLDWLDHEESSHQSYR